LSDTERVRCTWEGCWRTSAQPYADDWAYLCLWPRPVKDGFYCKPHADALEAVDMAGGFEDENGAMSGKPAKIRARDLRGAIAAARNAGLQEVRVQFDDGTKIVIPLIPDEKPIASEEQISL
jgi:hypothetical protein